MPVDFRSIEDFLIDPLIGCLEKFCLEHIPCDNNLRWNIFFATDPHYVVTYKWLKKETCAAILCERIDFLYWRCLTNPSFLLKALVSWLFSIFVVIPIAIYILIVVGLSCTTEWCYRGKID